MADSADVRSLDALRDARAAVCLFSEDAKNALADVDFDIRRTIEWLQNDQRLYWQSEIRRWNQNLTMAKADLARKKLGRFLDHKPDTSQEEKAVKHAEARLEDAGKKLELVRRWVPELQHAVQEYRGSSQPLASMVEVDLRKALVRLDRMLESLEAYAQLAAPRVPVGPLSADSMSRSDPDPTGVGAAVLAPEKSDDERQRGLEQAEPRDADPPREMGPDRA